MTGEKLKIQLQPKCRDSQWRQQQHVNMRRTGGEIVTRERHAELEECNVEIR